MQEHDKLKVKDRDEEIWCAPWVLHFDSIKLLLIITVNSKQRKIVNVERDIDKYFISNEDTKSSDVDISFEKDIKINMHRNITNSNL